MRIELEKVPTEWWKKWQSGKKSADNGKDSLISEDIVLRKNTKEWINVWNLKQSITICIKAYVKPGNMKLQFQNYDPEKINLQKTFYFILI